MVNTDIVAQVEEVSKRPGILGWKLSGAGGGGYLILVSDGEVAGTLRIAVRREH
jgi:mevalonate kinase